MQVYSVKCDICDGRHSVIARLLLCILRINKNIIRFSHENRESQNDIAALIELLKMEAEHWPRSRTDEGSLSELFCRDQTLLEMWPAPEPGGMNFRPE
jgi:hypothetical protein